MEKIIFDTNFILTCVKEKIDFISELEGYQLLLPEQVIKEIEKISVDRKKRIAERELAKLSLAIIEHNKSKFRIIELEKKFVDAGLLRVKEPGELIIATLDRQLKSMLKGKFKTLIITKRKKLEIVG
jgi:rRNA-processing protein FCF1